MKRKEKLFKRSLSLGLMLSLLAAPVWAAPLNLGEVTVTYKDAYGNDVTEPTSEAHPDAANHIADKVIYAGSTAKYYGSYPGGAQGVLTVETAGNKMVFDNGSKVNINLSGSTFRGIWISGSATGYQNDRVASSFAGELNITAATAAGAKLPSRAFHADFGLANFEENSITNITVKDGSKAGSMGLVATHGGVINLSGTLNAISHAGISESQDIYANNNTGSAVSIGWHDNNGNASSLNITSTGKLYAKTDGNTDDGSANAISILSRGTITSEVGSSITAEATYASKAALFLDNLGGEPNRITRTDASSFITMGSVSLTNNNGKAIWFTSSAATLNKNTATISIDGTDSSSDVKITGDILNEAATKNDSLKVSMKGMGSFLTGNNMLTKAGSTELTFDTDTKWTGNNTVNTTDGGIMTTNLKDNAVWDGNNTVENGENNVNMSGTASWTGSNTVENGKNNVNMSGTASWAGSNNVKNGENIISLKGGAVKAAGATDSISGGTNTVVVDEEATYASDGKVTGGTNNITVKGTKGEYKGNLNVSGGTNAVAIDQKGEFSGNITVAAGGTNSLTGLDQGKLSGALNVTGGTNTGTFAASSAITGPVKVSAGTSNMGFSNSAKLSGSLEVSGGTSAMGFKDTAKLTGETTVSGTGNNTLGFSNNAEQTGALNVTGGTNTGIFADSAIMSGDLSVSGGTSSIGFKDTAKLTGKTTVSGTGNNTLGFSNNAEQTGALNVTGGTNTGVFADNAIMSGSLSVSGGTSEITFGDNTQFTTASTTEGGVNNINLKANAQWTNTTNNANGGTVNITATDAAKLTNLNNKG